MKKTFLLLIIMCGVTLMSSANPVSPEEALQKAREYLIQGMSLRVKGKVPSLSLARTINLPAPQADQAALYIFRIGDDGGFVIASADDNAKPVLGHCDNGNSSLDDLPPNFKDLLDFYVEQIAWARSSTLASVDKTKPRAKKANGRKDIWPLLTTYWDQREPYNDMCVFDGERCMTGCVATAMAQLLYYWATTGKDGKTFRGGCTSLIGYNNSDFDVPPLEAVSTFDWDNMRESYWDSEEGDEGEEEAAVAQLMRYCGQAANMYYGFYESGATESDAMSALFCNFHCFSNMQLKKNDKIPDKEWEQMIYNELENGRPVFMCGYGTDGHAFLCDGYDSEYDEFHFNWGWSGGWDGCYAMDALFLGEIEYDGHVFYEHNFNNHKTAIINFNPLASEPEPTRYVVLSDDSTTMTLYYDSEYGVRNGHLMSLPEANYCGWRAKEKMTLEIDRSFANCHPEDVFWFNLYNCDVSAINGLQYFNTDRVTDMNGMFSSVGATTLDLRTFDTSNVGDMSYMFCGCEYLEHLDLRSFGTSNVEDMSNMFDGCHRLKSIDLRSFDTSKVKDVSEMFWGCGSLESLDLSPLDFSSVTRSNKMFDYCPKLKFISIPATAANLADDAFIHVGSSEPCLISAPDDFDFGVDTSGDSFMWKGGCFKLYRPSHILLGDVNHDGEVTIVDVTLMVNYTLTHGGENFYFENADMNHDNVVTVTDINKVVDLILKTNVMP